MSDTISATELAVLFGLAHMIGWYVVGTVIVFWIAGFLTWFKIEQWEWEIYLIMMSVGLGGIFLPTIWYTFHLEAILRTIHRLHNLLLGPFSVTEFIVIYVVIMLMLYSRPTRQPGDFR